jgi:nucleoside triphosphate pyrophosphatase
VVKGARMATPQPDLLLASASPRRRELLERMGLALQVAPADIDETPQAGEAPMEYARRIAATKCDHVAGARPPSTLPVLAADTSVVVDGAVFGKPTDADDARGMLARLGGRRHDVITAYRIRAGGRHLDRAVTTTVSFRALQAAEIDAYVASEEWRGKAGGYAIQGIAAAFVTDVRGSITNVIGLPLAEVLADLLALGALPHYPPPAFGTKAA